MGKGGYKKREPRVVSLNSNDPEELELLRIFDRDDVNFSGLTKRLWMFALWGYPLPRHPVFTGAREKEWGPINKEADTSEPLKQSEKSWSQKQSKETPEPQPEQQPQSQSMQEIDSKTEFKPDPAPDKPIESQEKLAEQPSSQVKKKKGGPPMMF